MGFVGTLAESLQAIVGLVTEASASPSEPLTDARTADPRRRELLSDLVRGVGAEGPAAFGGRCESKVGRGSDPMWVAS